MKTRSGKKLSTEPVGKLTEEPPVGKLTTEKAGDAKVFRSWLKDGTGPKNCGRQRSKKAIAGLWCKVDPWGKGK